MTMQPQQQPVDCDDLGIASSPLLDAFARASWDSVADAGQAMSVLLVGLDDFERYGDGYGPQAADILVRRAEAVLRACGLGSAARVGRLPAGEFVVILPGATLDTTRIPSERILRAIRDLEIPHRGSTVANYVTVSIGAASCRPQPGDSLVTLIDAGASALWSAKRRGHNRICAYELSPGSGVEETVSDVRLVG